MINPRQLEVLCAVIEVGTTARAADLLNVSQPAVSNMIRHTEDLVGFPLFVRERGRLVPTREAQHIAQEAQYLFMQQKRVENVINELRGGTVGRLHIVATPSIGHGILPRVIAEFVKNKPKLKLSIELGSIDENIERLVSGQADIGLSITQPRHSMLSVRPVAEGRMMCVCPTDHEMALSERVNVTDLNHVRHISYAAGTPLGQIIDTVFSKQGLERCYFCAGNGDFRLGGSPGRQLRSIRPGPHHTRGPPDPSNPAPQHPLYILQSVPDLQPGAPVSGILQRLPEKPRHSNGQAKGYNLTL